MTFPAYAVAVLLNGSSAVTVNENALPAVTAAELVTAKCVAASALTAIVPLCPDMVVVILSDTDSV